ERASGTSCGRTAGNGRRGGDAVAKKKQPRKWAWVPSAGASKPTLDAQTKAQVEQKVQELIDKELKPRRVEKPPQDARFNYVTDVKLSWHGSTLFLVSVYACPGPDAITLTFEDRFARPRPTGPRPTHSRPLAEKALTAYQTAGSCRVRSTRKPSSGLGPT